MQLTIDLDNRGFRNTDPAEFARCSGRQKEDNLRAYRMGNGVHPNWQYHLRLHRMWTLEKNRLETIKLRELFPVKTHCEVQSRLMRHPLPGILVETQEMSKLKELK